MQQGSAARPPVEKLLWRLLTLAVGVIATSWLLSAGAKIIGFLPIGALLFFLILYTLQQQQQTAVNAASKPGERRGKQHLGMQDVYHSRASQHQPQEGPPSSGEWQAQCGSPVVAFAWEKVVGSIVQQWVYDTWWSSLSPDIEFPAEVRRMLNSAFGAACARARHVDARTLLVRDVCDALVDALELQRAVVAAVGPDTWATGMSPAAREGALRTELKAMGALHPALCTPDGHYKVLRTYSEILLQALLPDEPMLEPRAVAVLVRELVCTCVLRPVMMLFYPQFMIKMIMPNLQPLVKQQQPTASPPAQQRVAAGGAQQQTTGAQGAGAQRSAVDVEAGAQEFEAKIAASVAAEQRSMALRCHDSSAQRAHAASTASLSGAPSGAPVDSHPLPLSPGWQDGPRAQPLPATTSTGSTWEAHDSYDSAESRMLRAAGGGGGGGDSGRCARWSSEDYESGRRPLTHRPSASGLRHRHTQSQGLRSEEVAALLRSEDAQQGNNTGPGAEHAAPTLQNTNSPGPGVGSPSGGQASQQALPAGDTTQPTKQQQRGLAQIASAAANLASAAVQGLTSGPGLEDKVKSWSAGLVSRATGGIARKEQGPGQQGATGQTETGRASGHASGLGQQLCLMAGGGGGTGGWDAQRAPDAVLDKGGEQVEGLVRLEASAENNVVMPGGDARVGAGSNRPVSPARSDTAVSVTSHCSLPARSSIGVSLAPPASLKARVVAPEITTQPHSDTQHRMFSGPSEVVTYKIRVESSAPVAPNAPSSQLHPLEASGPSRRSTGDAPGTPSSTGTVTPVAVLPHTATSWTVAHRFRDFEALHAALLKHPTQGAAYKASGLVPPPKRVLGALDPRFIERRRTELDTYLTALLSHPALATTSEVLTFLGCPPTSTNLAARRLRTVSSDTYPHFRPPSSIPDTPKATADVSAGPPVHSSQQQQVNATAPGYQLGHPGNQVPGDDSTSAEPGGAAALPAASQATVHTGDSGSSTMGTFRSLLNRVADAATAAKEATFKNGKAGGSQHKQEGQTGQPQVQVSLSDSGYGASMWVLSPADLTGADEAPGQVHGAAPAAQQSLNGSPSQGKEVRQQQEQEEGGMLTRLVKSVANSKGVAGVKAWAAERSSSASSFTRQTSTPDEQQQQSPADTQPAKDPGEQGRHKESSAAREGLARVSQLLQRGVRGLASNRDCIAPEQQLSQEAGAGGVNGLHEVVSDEEAVAEVLVPSCGSGVVVAGSISTAPVPAPESRQHRDSEGSRASGAGSKAQSAPPPARPPALDLSGADNTAELNPLAASLPSSGPPEPPSGPPGASASGQIPLSAPLYELLDAVFQISSTGFFARQAIAVVRQLLALVAGDAIDEAIASQLRSLTSEHSIARLLLTLQRTLWPGGRWFAFEPTYQAATAAEYNRVMTRRAAQAAQAAPVSHSVAVPDTASGASSVPDEGVHPPVSSGSDSAVASSSQQQSCQYQMPLPLVLKPETYLDPLPAPTAGEDAEAVGPLRDLLLGALKPGGAVAGLLGSRTWAAGVATLCDLLSSATMMLQIGYSLIEAGLLALVPEAEPRIQALRVEAAAAPDE